MRGGRVRLRQGEVCGSRAGGKETRVESGRREKERTEKASLFKEED